MTFLQLKVENLTNENLGGQNENLGGQGPTEDKKDNPATRLYVLCQDLTPIGLYVQDSQTRDREVLYRHSNVAFARPHLLIKDLS